MSELEMELMKTKIEYYNSKKIHELNDDELHEYMEFRREARKDFQRLYNSAYEMMVRLIESLPDEYYDELIGEL